jgi:hypothetical protein
MIATDSNFKQRRFIATPSRSRRAARASFAINIALSEAEGAGNARRTMRPQPRMQNKMSIQA